MNKIILILLITIALGLRLINLQGTTTFDWDQERDIEIVNKIVTTKRPVLIGPVVKGEGGFLLGPLYYYLLIPAHIVARANPLGLVATSIILDLTVIALLYYTSMLITKNNQVAIISASLWTFSWDRISASHTSWNVSLIPLFTLLVIYCLYKISQSGKKKWIINLAFLQGLSLHVHPTVFLLIPAAFLAVIKRSLFKSKTLFLAFLALLVPLAPLILFELRHEFTNSKLFMRFFKSPPFKSDWISFTQTFFLKLTKTFSHLIIGKQHVAIGALLLLILSIYLVYSAKKPFSKITLYIVLLTFISLFSLRDINFAEYYFSPLFAPLTLATAFFIGDVTKSLSSNYLAKTFPFIFISLIVIVNMQSFSFDTQGYSLLEKQAVIESIRESSPVEIDFQLPLSRANGFQYLLKLKNIQSQQDSDRKIVITESSTKIVVPEGASNIQENYFGGFKTTIYLYKIE